MKSYSSYKDSGLEWIGEIPNHWEKRYLKHFFKYKKGSKGQQLTKSFIEENKGTYPVYSGQTENQGVLGNINEFEFDYPYGVLFTTTVGVKMMSTKVLKDKFSLSQNCLIMVPFQDINTNFVNYFVTIDWKPRREQFPKILQPSFRMEDIDQYQFLNPPLPEQTQIVSFLDTKTQKIDELIEKTEQKIKLLKEKRTSLINHCVTKGLNPDVEMKDSGVEWIGEIPNKWDVKKLKYFSSLHTEKEDTSMEDIKISPENVESYTGICFNLYSEYDGKGVPFKSGDILLNKLRLYLVKILLPDYDGFSMGEMIVIRVNENVSNKYYFYLLFNQGLIDLLDSQSTGIKVPRVSPEIIMGSDLPYPPKNEQTQIVEYLDEQTQKIDSTIEKETQRIELLKEYRQSLISEVVTGKIDVRDWKE